MHNSSVCRNTATESLSLHILRSSGRIAYGCWMGVFEGRACDASQRCCAGTRGRGLWASPCSPAGPSFLCTVRTASSAFHLLFASQLPRADSWRAHMTSFGAAARSGPSWWMPYWDGDGTDSLSKTTLQARLCVPKLSDWFREICYEIAACHRHHHLLFAASSAGHEGFCSTAASEQRLSIPRWDYNARSARLLPDWNNDLSGRLLS